MFTADNSRRDRLSNVAEFVPAAGTRSPRRRCCFVLFMLFFVVFLANLPVNWPLPAFFLDGMTLSLTVEACSA